jgi:hypothetical protein
MRRCSVLSGVLVTGLTIVIVVQVLASHCFPLGRGLWLVGEERGLADRTAPGLGFEEPEAGVVDRQDWFASSLGSVVGKRGVVG